MLFWWRNLTTTTNAAIWLHKANLANHVLKFCVAYLNFMHVSSRYLLKLITSKLQDYSKTCHNTYLLENDDKQSDIL